MIKPLMNPCITPFFNWWRLWPSRWPCWNRAAVGSHSWSEKTWEPWLKPDDFFGWPVKWWWNDGEMMMFRASSLYIYPVLSCPIRSCPVLSCPVLSCPSIYLSIWTFTGIYQDSCMFEAVFLRCFSVIVLIDLLWNFRIQAAKRSRQRHHRPARGMLTDEGARPAMWTPIINQTAPMAQFHTISKLL